MFLMYGHSKVTPVWNVKLMHGTRVFNLLLKDTFMTEFMKLTKMTHKNKRKVNKEKLSKWLSSFLQSGMVFIQDILFHSSIGLCYFKYHNNFSEWKETHLNLLKWKRNLNILSCSSLISSWDILEFVLFLWVWIIFGNLYQQCTLFHQ